MKGKMFFFRANNIIALGFFSYFLILISFSPQFILLYHFLLASDCNPDRRYNINSAHNKKAMVEVIHRHHKNYPFGLDKPNENTFLCVIRQNLSEQEISSYRQKNKILKELPARYFIKVHKLLKEESNLHFHYEYFPLGLDKYVEGVKSQGEGSKENGRQLLFDFNANIEGMVEQLVKLEIKADIFLYNLAVVPDERQAMQLKAYLDPESEFLAIMEHQYRPENPKRKDRASINQEYLVEFYQAQRKRLYIEFQELVQQYFGKIKETEKRQMPNFVINGTKLMFLPSSSDKDGGKNSKIEIGKTKKVQEDSKKNLGQAEQRMQNNTPTMNKNSPQQHSNKPKIEKIVNFDQSFQPQFKPQEFTNENTYVFQENDYLESLEQQLVKLASDKKLPKNSPIKQQRSKQENSTAQDKKINDSQKSIGSHKQIKPSPNNPQNSNGSINQNQSNSNVSNHSNQQALQTCKAEPKDTAIIEEKVFKYKMKIITSHQIEIQGDGEPNVEEIERDIMEGIKTGKLNINDLAVNKKTTTVASQNKSGEMNVSNDNSKEMSGSSHTQKSATVTTANFHKDSKEKIVQSSHEGTKKDYRPQTQQQSQPQTQTQPQAQSYPHHKHYQNPPQNHSQPVLQTRSSDLQQGKMKSINEIIQKIYTKSHQNAQNAQNNQLKQSKTHHFKQFPQQSKQTQSAHHKPQINEQKVERADNYLVKIRQAKQKAELILREYTKKKQ